MDFGTAAKVVVGSTAKAVAKAKVYGTLDLRALYLFNIITDMQNFCELNLAYSQARWLSKFARDIQNKYDYICQYKKLDIDKKLFINNKQTWKLNGISVPGSSLVASDSGQIGAIGATLSFTSADFTVGLTASEILTVADVRITALPNPSLGTLQYNGIDLVQGQIILIGNINLLTFESVDTLTLVTDIIFKFQLGDNELLKTYSNMATYTVTVNASVNLPPSAVGDGSQTTGYGVTIVYSVADLTSSLTPPYADPEGDSAENLRVLSLPVTGTLKIDGVDAIINDIVSFTDIGLGKLTYVPDNATLTGYADPWDFEISDEGSSTYTS